VPHSPNHHHPSIFGLPRRLGSLTGPSFQGLPKGHVASGKMSSQSSRTSRALERGFSAHFALSLIYLAQTYSSHSGLFVSLRRYSS
jgi:hypothetical protein